MKANRIFPRPFILVFLSAILLFGCGKSKTVVETKPYSPWDDPRIFEAGAHVDMTISASRDKRVKFPMISAKDTVVSENSKRYYITSGLRDITEENQEFRQYASYIENSLKTIPVIVNNISSRYDLIRTEDKSNADYLFSLAYGIGEPQFSDSTRKASIGDNYTAGSFGFKTPSLTNATKTGSYSRNIFLEIYDLKKPGNPMLAKITMTSLGTTGDLRQIFPYMIAAGMPWSLEGTTLQRYITFQARNPKILSVLFGTP